MKTQNPKPNARIPIIILSLIGMLFFYLSFIGNFTPYGMFYKTAVSWATTILAAVLAPLLLLYVLVIYKFMSTRLGLIIRYSFAVIAGVYALVSLIYGAVNIINSDHREVLLSFVVWRLPDMLLLGLYAVILILLFRRGQIRPFVVIAFIILMLTNLVGVISFAMSVPDLTRQLDGVYSMGFWDVLLTYLGFVGVFFATISRFIFVMANAPNREKPEKKEIDRDSPITEYTIT